jgi:cytidylate kinase
MSMIITIDGPVASGKTSVARVVANRLGYTYLASGMLYRAVAYILVDRYFYDETKLRNPIATDIEIITQHLIYENQVEGPHVYYGPEDITLYLKTPTVDTSSSLLATTPYIHQVLLVLQRTIATGKNIVIESRDAGTTVFPDAQRKIFLTASNEERARRWQKDQESRGIVVSFERACQLISERDIRDTTRVVSPLVCPPDAYLIDSTNTSFDDVVRIIIEYNAK